MRLLDKFKSKKLEYTSYMLLNSLIIFYGFYTGLNITSASLNIFFLAVDVVVLNAASSAFFFTFFIVLTGFLLLKELYSRKEIPECFDKGEVTAVIPVYNDASVIENSVSSLNNSNYENLNIVVGCEPGDSESINKAQDLNCEVLINEHPGSKAGAINTAFEEYSSSYFAVFDADEKIRSNFIPRAIGSIEEGYDAFQGRRVPIPSGVVEGFAYCERVLFHSAYKISELSGFRNLRSSSTVMKREVWEEVGGYEDLLTEDLDFPHKCFRAEVDIRQDRRVTNLMEAPHSWRDFWNQRKRWRMGQIQILHKALKGGYGNNFSYRGFISTGRLIFSVIVGFLILTMIPKFLILFLLDLDLISLTPLISSIALVLLVSLKDRTVDEIKFIGWKSGMTPGAFIVTGFLAVKSLLEYFISWEGEWYDVQKTGE